ncbi:putative spermidine/putrescine transport system substrate-binding protein [Thermocatellispora tengchongensis]|uniref:Putative spermidine/putrescine transport system substrate-binding protein n=1 Tax=Thermocatellispora tengchongensis TaxID=1073253 RepID=A0A840P7Q6_9ACTN|nr:ABC transporter substrate-binding protein [Thermocatellispora tengchongensis]MBB5133953.1 putative spermidine/putrescine transport system substrate-binding protein [Thermocatellispora tengchongensis]
MTVRTRAAASVILFSALAGCGAPATEEGKKLPPVNPEAASLKEGFATMERLVEAAKKEGTLTVVGLPRDWVNFGEIIDAFSDKYGIKVEELDPQANSRAEIAAARAPKKRGAHIPDVFDLSLDVAVANAGMFAPYRVQTWHDIPDRLKDHQARWYAGYAGYMSLAYDPSRVKPPAGFSDLLRPGYSVALPGDPRETASAFGGVMAASLGPGGPKAERGVAYFGRLKRVGNLAAPGKQATVVLDWDFLNAERAARGGDTPWKVVYPRDAVLGAFYVQAINKHAPHPAAARLWQEFLFSDEAQNLFLKGYARPARIEALQMRGTLDDEAAAKLPPAPASKPVFLTVPEADEAKTYLRRAWAKTVG